MVSIPHFSLPFNFGQDGHANVVQQDSLEEVGFCVEAVVRTEHRSRLFVPNFGIVDPTFDNRPLDLVAIQAQIVANEPRAVTTLTQFPDRLDKLIDNIKVEVRSSGNQ